MIATSTRPDPPAVTGRRRDTVDDRGDGEGDRDGTGDVDPGTALRSGGGLKAGEGGGEQAGADRHVDEQHPAPAQRGGEDAAEHAAGGSGGGGRDPPPRERASALAGIGVAGGDQAEARGSERGGAGPLDEACRKQHHAVLGEASEQAGRGEHGQPELKDAAAAEQIADARGEQQKTAEGDQVAVYDPLLRVDGQAERRLHRGKRDVHDARVEHHHELRQARDHGDDGQAHPRLGDLLRHEKLSRESSDRLSVNSLAVTG
jgi:hypothetical protein